MTDASKKKTAKKLTIAGASIAFSELSGGPPIARVVKKKQLLTLQLSTQQGDDVVAAAMKTLTTQAANRF